MLRMVEVSVKSLERMERDGDGDDDDESERERASDMVKERWKDVACREKEPSEAHHH